MPDGEDLLRALTVIRDRGAIGTTELPDAIAHADRFVAVLPDRPHRLADLGSGGGLPGLVIAVRRPDIDVTLIERRGNRADLLRRAVASLRLGTQVTVLAADVEEVARRSGAVFDVVTARSFGGPDTTLHAIARLLAAGGQALISEPPQARSEQWQLALSRHRGFVDQGVDQGIRRLTRVSLN